MRANGGAWGAGYGPRRCFRYPTHQSTYVKASGGASNASSSVVVGVGSGNSDRGFARAPDIGIPAVGAGGFNNGRWLHSLPECGEDPR
jgi:hypothetical protein